MTENKTDYKKQIEALLFASGRFIDIDTLLNLTGAAGKQVLINNINKLKREYEGRNSPLMIVEEKDGWKLTVREAYLPLVRKIVSETELPKTILETLAVIAWKAPVLQSEVINIRHNKAYDHISELQELGFLRKEPHGRSFMLNLTEKFYEYFDVEGAKDIRDVFRKVVSSPEQTKVDDFEESLIEELSKEKKEIETPQETPEEETNEFNELEKAEKSEGETEDEDVEEFSELDEVEETKEELS
jgi:segregation and condensation protein B